MIDNDLIDLILAWRGGELPPARCDELIARLESDDLFLQSFVEEIRLLGMLKAVQSTEPRWLALHEALGWGNLQSGSAEDADEDSIMQGLEGHSPRRFTRVGLWRSVAIAATLLVAALGWFAWSKGVVGGGHWNWPVPVKPGNELAVLTKLSDVKWETPNGQGPAEGELLSSGRFRVRSGQAILVFLNGVTLTLDGPADIDLVSINRVFCRQGRLRARVPKGVEGFVVASQGSAVVDLGTEFAMNVDSQGKSQVMVFEGAAKASLLDAKGFPSRTQRVDESKQFDVDPNAGHIAETQARPDQFISVRDTGPPALRLAPEYSKTVMKSRPLSYWRFGSVTKEGIPNEVAGGPPLLLHGPIRIESNPQSNGHAVFTALAPEQCLTTGSLWKLTRGSRHAIEFWFMSESINHASLVGLYPAEHNMPKSLAYKHVMLIEATAYPTLSLEKPASVRFLRRWLRDVDLAAQEDGLFSQNIYLPKRWYHVVAQRNGQQLELYLNGVRDRTLTSETDPPGILYHLVVGRRTAEPAQVEESRPFVGRFDELVLYDHPLSAEEVRSHFQLAAPQGGLD